MEGFGPVQVEVGGHRVEATEQGRADGQRNDFVGDGGRVIVSIRSSDGGFYADNDCGSWSRRGGSSSNLASPGATDSFQIDQNYRRHRAEMGR